MLGVSDKSWLVEMLYSAQQRGATSKFVSTAMPGDDELYNAYFGLGQSVRLRDRPGVFRVSLAGLVLGAYLLKFLDDESLTGRFLDLGTGSGVLAFLLRRLGARQIVATDVSAKAITLARENELLNFQDLSIRFQLSDVFGAFAAGKDRFDTIVFNPPGWRTPSQALLDDLRRISGEADMEPAAMFYGDELMLRFLNELPRHLTPGGRAIIGMNSLVGIQDVIERYKGMHAGQQPLKFRLVERHTLPLLYYSPAWERASERLMEEFRVWQNSGLAAFSTDSQGRLYWSYEVVELRLATAKED
jgi:release factor glutamine methyltransferase